MNRAILSITLILCLALATTSFATPSLLIREPVFNFGTISEGAKVDHVFMLKNAGTSPLSIQQIRPSCGCTAATISSKTIQPGETGEIKTTFNSANFSGNIHKTIVVETNDPKTPSSTLVMKGLVSTSVQLNPKQLNFGQVKAGNPATLTLSVVNRSQKGLKITGVSTPMPQVAVKAEKLSLKPGETTRIQVTVTPRDEDRILSGYLTITTDSPEKGELTVPIYGSPAR